MSIEFERLEAALPQRYTLIRELARGGMSRVYLARESMPGRDVVIKVLDHELYPHSTEPERCEFGFEHVNVVSDAAHAQTVKELAAGLRAGWKGALPSGVAAAAAAAAP